MEGQILLRVNDVFFDNWLPCQRYDRPMIIERAYDSDRVDFQVGRESWEKRKQRLF
jgi:hypothetical protein